MGGVCASVALRDLNLLDSLLEQLERMQANEEDPDRLDQLYKLDHMATQLRRNNENLRLLAGHDAETGDAANASVLDIVRAALSSIDQYRRVELGKIAPLGIVGFAADDVSRLLAELLDNATMHSSPESIVSVGAHVTEQGSVLIRVEDAGIGVPETRLARLNERLDSAPVLDREAVDHMGLAVVRQLASRHGINVWLAKRAPCGTAASVLMPLSLIREDVSVRTGHCGQSEIPFAAVEKSPITGASESVTEPSAVVDEAPEHPVTSSGLPRRVPRRSEREQVVSRPGPTVPTGEPYRQLLDDLDAFAEGEKAARKERDTQTQTRDAGEGIPE